MTIPAIQTLSFLYAEVDEFSIKHSNNCWFYFNWIGEKCKDAPRYKVHSCDMLFKSSASVERITAKKHFRNSVVSGLAPVINAFVTTAVGYIFQRQDCFFICKVLVLAPCWGSDVSTALM